LTPGAGPGGGAWELAAVDGLVLARCAALEGIAGVAHAFSTRRDGGGDGFDLGAAGDASALTRERRERFLAAAGIDGKAAVLQRVHGDVVVDAEAAGDQAPAADGLLWAGGRFAPSVRAADCVPILIVDVAGRRAAALHAGWRGTAAGIVRRAVAMLEGLGIAPASLVAALGPAIGPCCYEVGPEVIAAVAGPSGAVGSPAARPSGPDGRHFLDLREVNRAQLAAAGLREHAIHLAPWCTRCRGDLFFSYRREGDAAGRLMASVGRRRP
jgi:YfiH family protein